MSTPSTQPANSTWYRRRGKRTLDLIGASAMSVLLAPAMAVTAILVACRFGRPVLFWQVRAGRHGRPFRICKFRTMTNATDAAGRLLPDEQRLTPLGRLLRTASVDEFPQLWNVLRGEMSLVGPRPLLTRYVDRYNSEQRRRLEVLPGLTGQAQVSGRNDLSWEQKFAHDIWYVDHVSARVDLRILFQTVGSLARRTGIAADGHATAPEFMGEPARQPSPHAVSNAAPAEDAGRRAA